MQVTFDQLKAGDFFTANINMGQDILLYQKIDQGSMFSHNAILLNTGNLCKLYTGPNATFEKVEVQFEIRSL